MEGLDFSACSCSMAASRVVASDSCAAAGIATPDAKAASAISFSTPGVRADNQPSEKAAATVPEGRTAVHRVLILERNSSVFRRNRHADRTRAALARTLGGHALRLPERSIHQSFMDPAEPAPSFDVSRAKGLAPRRDCSRPGAQFGTRQSLPPEPERMVRGRSAFWRAGSSREAGWRQSTRTCSGVRPDARAVASAGRWPADVRARLRHWPQRSPGQAWADTCRPGRETTPPAGSSS